MCIHQNRQSTVVTAARAVDTDGDLAAGARNGVVADLGDGFWPHRRHEPGADDRPGLSAGHGVHRREAGVQRLDQGRDLRIEVHAYCKAGRDGAVARRGSNGRNGCRVGATRCGPPSTLRQMPIAVIRTGAASR